jgi:hypothetical protein
LELAVSVIALLVFNLIIIGAFWRLKGVDLKQAASEPTQPATASVTSATSATAAAATGLAAATAAAGAVQQLAAAAPNTPTVPTTPVAPVAGATAVVEEAVPPEASSSRVISLAGGFVLVAALAGIGNYVVWALFTQPEEIGTALAPVWKYLVPSLTIFVPYGLNQVRRAAE